MKVGTTEKIKFKRTKRAFGLPLWQTVGLLESIWMSAYQNAPAGDIGKMSNEDIAAAIEWEGSPDELIAQLVKDGWLDEDKEFRLIVHDWSNHVAQFLKGAFAKHGRLFADQIAKQRAKQPAKQDANSTMPGTLPPIQFNSIQVKSEEEEANGHTTTEALIAYLRAPPFGLTEADRAVTAALGRGCGPDQIKATADYWLSRRPRWSEGQLCRRLEKAMPTDKPDAAWPRPDKNAPAARPKLDPEVEAVNREVLARQRGAGK